MQTKTNIKAEIVADSINQQGDRLTSLKITFPRIILAEINTHRMLCLAGDSELYFDLPTPSTGSENFRLYKMSIADFVTKWKKGAAKRNRHSYKVYLEDKEYSAKEIGVLIGKAPSNIRSKCRDGSIKVINPNKKRSEDFIINGIDYNLYHNSLESKGQDITSRLNTMKIRTLDESTGRIVHSTIKDCFISGEKEVFKITLKDGKSLKCSKDHKILTESGWKALKDIEIGEYIIVQSHGIEEMEKSNPKDSQFIKGKWVSQFLRKNRGIIIDRQNHECNSCKIATIEDMHHIIPIYKDSSKAFDLDNIEGLCKDCHNFKHSEQDWQVSQYLYGKPEEVISIISDGFEQTYDIEIEGEYPNFVCNGIIVHNSKNTSSSRAIPFKKMVEVVENDPFIPIAWQKPHKGMQGTEYYDHTLTEKIGGLDYTNLPRRWLRARDTAVSMAKIMADERGNMPVTKQLANRLLEPFMWTTMLITGSKEGWNNFFRLRCPQYYYDLEDKYFKSKKEWLTYYKANCIGDPNSNFELDEMDWFNINKGQAEIHMMDLAEKIYDAMNESIPNQLKSGEWHIPYENKIDLISWLDIVNDDGHLDGDLDEQDRLFLIDKVKMSTAMAARVSYTIVGDEKEIDYQKQLELHDRLISQDPPHSSPLEHCARAMNDLERYAFIKGETYHDKVGNIPSKYKGWCTNIKGFIPYRYMIDNNLEM